MDAETAGGVGLISDNFGICMYFHQVTALIVRVEVGPNDIA